ncbi:MAG: hypothetical protein PHH26_07595, partial [Candidatus Thermoplasmatota archaeon]|nr:hypothetical protein [Candidatus Thermoplasmatota archaeon]
GSALALMPVSMANEGVGSNEPLAFEKNKLYLQAKAGSPSTPFMSIEPIDPDGDKETYGPTTQGIIMSSIPPEVPVLGGYSNIDFLYMPSTACSVEFDSSKDATANIEIVGRQVDVPLAPAPLPSSIPGSEPLVMGSINFALSVLYGDKELVRQEFSQQQIAGGQSFTINLKFKMPEGLLTIGNETGLLFRFTNMGGYSTGSYGIVVKGKSYLEFPIIENKQTVEEQTNETAAGNTTTGDSTASTDQTASNADTEAKTPGFEFAGLACAVGVAVLLVRRKH